MLRGQGKGGRAKANGKKEGPGHGFLRLPSANGSKRNGLQIQSQFSFLTFPSLSTPSFHSTFSLEGRNNKYPIWTPKRGRGPLPSWSLSSCFNQFFFCCPYSVLPFPSPDHPTSLKLLFPSKSTSNWCPKRKGGTDENIAMIRAPYYLHILSSFFFQHTGRARR